MKIKIIRLFTVIFFLTGTSAFAQNYSSEGGYLVLGGITGFQNFMNTDRTGQGGETISSVDDSLGFELTFGYRASKHISAELEWDFLSGFDVNTSAGTLSLDTWILTGNLKYAFLTDRIQPFIFGGIGGMYADLQTTGGAILCGWWWCYTTNTQIDNSFNFASRWGGGIDYYFTENFAVSLDASYVLPTGKLDDLQYTSFNWGFLYKYY